MNHFLEFILILQINFILNAYNFLFIKYILLSGFSTTILLIIFYYSIVISPISRLGGEYEHPIFLIKISIFYIPTIPIIMSENILIILPKIFKIFGCRYTYQKITFIIKFTWFAAPKSKLKQI